MGVHRTLLDPATSLVEGKTPSWPGPVTATGPPEHRQMSQPCEGTAMPIGHRYHIQPALPSPSRRKERGVDNS
jgi:hypothetical protein